MPGRIEYIPDAARLTKKVRVDPATGCWVWCGSKHCRTGYGYCSFKGRSKEAHRAFYIMYKAEIPTGYDVDHLCRNRICVNPDHLEAVTRRENLVRGNGFVGKQHRQTHCKRGHELTGANLYVTKRGWRKCRRCHCDRVMAVYKLRKGAANG